MAVHNCENHFLRMSRFTEFFILKNGFQDQGFKEWLLWPGMLFDAEIKWWGNQGRRNKPHEGLDLCL